MHLLWKEFNNHPVLGKIVNTYNDLELSIRLDMEQCTTGSVEWCMLEMKRYQILNECKLECKSKRNTLPKNRNMCASCYIPMVIDSITSTFICQNCGYSVNVLLDHICDYSSMSRYNGNRRHHYNHYEHFSQTVNDFTCSGIRNVPPNVFEYCRALLGQGLHVTSEKVFDVLQMGKYARYYQYKYEITNRLRGKPEFIVNSREIAEMKEVYIRYKNEFFPFQQSHNIGFYASNGKLRLFWPVRFILAKICEEIRRPDLIQYIRKICDQRKLEKYNFYWDKLKRFVDSTRPKRDTSNRSLMATCLRPKVSQ